MIANLVAAVPVLPTKLLTAPLSLASVDAVDSYRRGIYGQSSSSGISKPVLIGGTVLLLLWLSVYLFDRWSKARKTAATVDRSLFGNLCSTHGLTAQERTYLEALAKQADVEPPVAIFIRPEVVEPLAASGSQAEMWQSIGDKIYGDWR